MTGQEWRRRNITLTDQLLREEPKTERGRDIWNLKYILFTIQKDSRLYRMGCVSTLRRTIKKLEKEENTVV